MAKSKATGTHLSSEFVSKSEPEDTPVASCKGWIDACEFCDKRFGNWLEIEDEVLDKILTKPGIFMIALKTKNATEVVDIILDESNLQKSVNQGLDRARDCVADKKSKFTKAVIMCRWMAFKNPGDKDVVNLCAHWINLGVLPKLLSDWPGKNILEKTNILEFSERQQKWCYPKKDPVWRKAKSAPSKVVELVEGCDWEKPCEICDNYFSKWVNMDDAIKNDRIPEGSGIYMVAVNCGKNREVVNICFDSNSIKFKNIAVSVKNTQNHLIYVLKNKKFANKNGVLQIRWMEMNDVESENSCFLYAHWLNAATIPIMSYKLPAEKILDRKKSFVLRVSDKKWCYELEMYKQMKNSKFKNKRQVKAELEEEYDMSYEN